MRTVPFIAGLLWVQFVQAAPLDDALTLVLAESAALTEKQAEVAAVAQQSGWTSKVRLGYNRLPTTTDASGLNAGVSVEIPLFSRMREIEEARARQGVAQARQQIVSAFLSEVATLTELEAKRGEAAEMAAFYRDRLEYFKQAVSEGRVESDTLWSDAEKAKKAEHDARQGEIRLAATLEESARRYGGVQWKRLRDLLAAHVPKAVMFKEQ